MNDKKQQQTLFALVHFVRTGVRPPVALGCTKILFFV